MGAVFAVFLTRCKEPMTKRLVETDRKLNEQRRCEKLHDAIRHGIAQVHPDQLEEFTALLVERLPRQSVESF